MKTQQDIVKEIENKADQFGMSNEQVANQYAGAIPQIQSEKIDERGEKEAEENKQKIIDLFKDELGVDAEDDTIWEAAVNYANEYSSII